jgi:PBP1b-binding outer membrane lipoprotein LpoB
VPRLKFENIILKIAYSIILMLKWLINIMKKIISTLFLGLLIAGCSTSPTEDTPTPKNYDTATTQPQSSSDDQPSQDDVARQQIQAFEANQIRLYTQPVNN